MQTKDIIVYGAIIYLFYLLRKKTTGCNCNIENSVLDNTKNLIDNNMNCCNCKTNIDLKNLVSLPKFVNINKQTEPTPATILNAAQLMVYNAKSIKGILPTQTYIC